MRESYVFFIPSKSIVSERINRQGGRLAVQQQLGQQQAGNRADAEAVTGKATGNRQSLYFFIPPHVRTSLVCFNRGKNSKIARAAVGAEMACDGLFFSVA